jgi:hypothetical protein
MGGWQQSVEERMFGANANVIYIELNTMLAKLLGCWQERMLGANANSHIPEDTIIQM